jgi:hypothetical protein
MEGENSLSLYIGVALFVHHMIWIYFQLTRCFPLRACPHYLHQCPRNSSNRRRNSCSLLLFRQWERIRAWPDSCWCMNIWFFISLYLFLRFLYLRWKLCSSLECAARLKRNPRAASNAGFEVMG